jgi:hypothetical protein
MYICIRIHVLVYTHDSNPPLPLSPLYTIFRCDKPYGGVGKPCVLFYIPDGKVVKAKK